MSVCLPFTGYNEGVAGATKENCSTNIRMELPVVPIAVLAAVWLSYLGAYLVLKNYLHACTAAFFATLACIYVPLIGAQSATLTLTLTLTH